MNSFFVGAKKLKKKSFFIEQELKRQGKSAVIVILLSEELKMKFGKIEKQNRHNAHSNSINKQ